MDINLIPPLALLVTFTLFIGWLLWRHIPKILMVLLLILLFPLTLLGLFLKFALERNTRLNKELNERTKPQGVSWVP